MQSDNSRIPTTEEANDPRQLFLLNEIQNAVAVEREDVLWAKHLTPEALAKAEKAERKEQEALALEAATKSEETVKWRMPDCPEPMRVIPSTILRSALFGVSRRGEREYVDDETMVAWKGSSIRYTGKRLDQYDLDVWMQAVHLVQHQNTGSIVYFTARGFLKAMGRKVSGYSVNTLFESLKRMVACAVTIKVGGINYTGSLIEMFAHDEHSDRYVGRLNPDLCRLFDTGHTRLHWETRLDLPTGLSRWLHGYVLSHQATKGAPHRIAVKTIYALTGSSAAALKKFREMLKHAMTSLEEASVVQGWRITDGDALEFVRPRAGV